MGLSDTARCLFLNHAHRMGCKEAMSKRIMLELAFFRLTFLGLTFLEKIYLFIAHTYAMLITKHIFSSTESSVVSVV